MKIVIFGTGQFFLNRKESFCHEDIVALIDNSSNRYGRELDGVRICYPAEIVDYQYDYICIMSSKYCNEMYSQLKSMGVNTKKIISYNQFLELKNSTGELAVFYPKCGIFSFEKKILMFTHELTLTGAPMVLYHAALVLLSKGYNIVVVSLKDGELKNKYLEAGVCVIIKEVLSELDCTFLQYINSFDLIFMCTLVFGEFVRNAKDKLRRPMIWWLHESEEFYSAWWSRSDPRPLPENIRIYNGGVRALETYNKYFEVSDGKNLLYGVPDENKDNVVYGHCNNNKFIIMCVGVLQPRKGQDILIKAFQNITESVRDEIEIWIIGPVVREYKEYGQGVLSLIEKENGIVYFGEKKIDQLLELMKQCDVLVSAALDDPMPVVIPEAMMFYKPCIVTTGTGTSYYINNMENGIVCEASVDSIEKAILWAYNNKDKLPSLGKKSRELFEKVFSMEAFEKNLLRIVEEKI